jgi:CheY-like chemotaxis protein
MNLPISVILAEDDEDDRLFFRDALHELTIPTRLTTVNDGEQLMTLLNNAENVLAQVLFLDINMPRKSGFDCLAEIKSSERLKTLPVIIFSTSFDKEVVDQLRDLGANYYMRKPGGFLRLKEIIQRSLDLMITTGLDQPTKDRFVLNVV